MFEEAQKRNPTKISLSLSISSFFVVPKLFGSSESGHKVKNCQRVENRSSVTRVQFSNLVSTTRKTFNKIVVLSHKRPNVF